MYSFILSFLFFVDMFKEDFSIIPRPNEISFSDEEFSFDEDVKFWVWGGRASMDWKVSHAEERKITEDALDYFFDILNIDLETSFTGHWLSDPKPISPKESRLHEKTKFVYFGWIDDESIGDEGYIININSHYVEILSNSPEGFFYATQTIRQLLPLKGCSVQSCVLPGLKIKDSPRFKWRGMHLDVGRHFFTVDEIKKFLDLLAFYKFNNFHWHLTEDQGWRIEIKKWPRLTEFGSCREESPKRGNRNVGDGVEYCGFYTQAEISDVVKYAEKLFINIVPEIEIPGHSSAAIASYPQFGNPGAPDKVMTRWGVSNGVYNIKKETFDFLEDVLDEVMALFPSEFIHIGGDEAPKGPWKNNPDVQEFIKKEGLGDEHGLQSWYIKKIESFLNSNGRRLIGWDEIQEGGLAPNAAMMVWRSWQYGIDAANKGHDIVMSPTSHSYFDYYQGDSENEPEAIGGYLPLKKVYSFEPVPEELKGEQVNRVLGAQGNLWTEYIYNWDKLMYMAFPRTAAMAEVVWTLPERKDYDDFLKRWQKGLPKLDGMGVKYRELSEDDF